MGINKICKNKELFRGKHASMMLFLMAISMLSSCQPAQYRKESGACWGTFFNVTYQSNKDLRDSILAVIEEIDKGFSMYRDDSSVSEFNLTGSVKATADMQRMLEVSQRVNEISGGMFDPTVAPIVELWGFGRNRPDSLTIPTDSQINLTLKGVGIKDCRITPEGILKGRNENTRLDFSAIAKGFGVDKVAEMLMRNGVENLLVEIGGEIRSHGKSARGDQWVIQIDAPVSGIQPGEVIHESMALIKIGEVSLATSGNYRNYLENGGKKVGHTMSPITGRPINTDMLSATVLAPSCMEADALATACMGLNASEALKMIEKIPGTEALLAVDSAGIVAIRKSSGFPKIME